MLLCSLSLSILGGLLLLEGSFLWLPADQCQLQAVDVEVELFLGLRLGFLLEFGRLAGHSYAGEMLLSLLLFFPQNSLDLLVLELF